jgi:hypothetical protein
MKKIQIIIWVFFLVVAFISCKKTSVEGETNSLTKEQSSILLWLNSQKVNNSTERVQKINDLSKNLLFDKLWTEKNDDLKFIIVPISEELKFSNNRGNKVSNYFVSAINSSSKIVYSVVIQYKPSVENINVEMKKGTIANINIAKPVAEDCNIRYISIYDFYLYELNYKNNKLISTLTMDKKIASNDNVAKQNYTSSLAGCTDWYWVTTYPDGTSTWEYLYTTCGNCSLPNPNEQTVVCENSNGDGGGQSDVGINVTRNATYIVREYQVGNENWRITGTFTISGIKYNNVANNVFTSITASGSPGTSACLNFAPAYSALPYMYGYFIFTEVSHNSYLQSPTMAFGTVATRMKYPNWQPAREDIHSLPHIWHASTDLF